MAGSIYLEFYLIIDVLGVPAMGGPVINQILTSLLAFPIPFIGGALWGAGLAALAGARAWPVVKRGMLSWGWTIVLGGILIDLTQIPVFALVPNLRFIPHITHWLFTLVFVPSIGLIVRKIFKALGMEEAKEQAGRWSGLAAARAQPQFLDHLPAHGERLHTGVAISFHLHIEYTYRHSSLFR